jgi:hypothetical protein
MNNTTVSTTEPNLIVLSFVILFIAIFSAFFAYLITDIIKITIEIYEAKKAKKKFFKLAIILLDLNPNSRDITALFSSNIKINESDPDFFNKLLKYIEQLKSIIVGSDFLYFDNQIPNVKIIEWINKINIIIDDIKRNHPFAGLIEDELIFFEHLNESVETGHADLVKSKIVELSKIVKGKNTRIEELRNENEQSKRISIASVFIGIIGIIIALLTWILG